MSATEEPGYNRFAETEIVNPPPEVTVTLNQEIAQAGDPAAISLSVPDQMLIVELSVPEPGAAGAALDGFAAMALRAQRRRRA